MHPSANNALQWGPDLQTEYSMKELFSQTNLHSRGLYLGGNMNVLHFFDVFPLLPGLPNNVGLTQKPVCIITLNENLNSNKIHKNKLKSKNNFIQF